ncbi:MAG TPA: signal peptidase I, partial [Acidimicrobiia bacterium]|nr:signal peptidase I [Acidimicrobiia bacterium]
MTELRDPNPDPTVAPVASADALPVLTRRARRMQAEGGPGTQAAPAWGDEEEEPTSPWRVALEWGGFVVAAILIAFVVKTLVFAVFYIPSGSMEPTLAISDRIAVSKLSYRLHDVHRGDIVVFEAPEGTRTAEIKDLVKRVIGLPGDEIEGHDGGIFINGQLLDQPWLPPGVQTDTFACETEYEGQPGCIAGRVPEGTYFVMGDNRGSSLDSRTFGPIHEDWIVGRAFLTIWPVTRIGFIGPSYTLWVIVGVA